jgi:hypothetical protein
MTDEQTIYLSPEEELTQVRERLEQTQARRIILVIPPQTQLRSHVGWRLIYSHMSKLHKELLVICPDRQVRAAAKAAGFKVAESQESPSNRPQLGSNTKITNINTRGSGPSRTGGPPSRSLQSPANRRPTSQRPSRRPQPSVPEPDDPEIEETVKRSPKPINQRPSKRPLTSVPEPDDPEIEETVKHLPKPINQRPSKRPLTSVPEPENFESKESLELPPRREREPDQSNQFVSTTFFEVSEAEEDDFGSSKSFYLSTTPSISHSAPPMEEDEEFSSYDYNKDYNTAREIRDAAREGNIEQASSAEEKESQISSTGKWNPYAYIEDDQFLPPPLPEQKGSAPSPIEEINTNAVDISDRSTEIMPSEIEDLGDQGAIELSEIEVTQEDQPSKLGRQPRSGSRKMPSAPVSRHLPRSPRPVQDFEDEEEGPLEIPDRPTSSGRGSGTSSRNLSGTGQRASQPITFNQHPSQPIAPGQRPSQTIAPGQRLSQPIAPGQRPSQPIAPEQHPSQPIAPGQRPSQTIAPGQRPSPSIPSEQHPSRLVASGSRTQAGSKTRPAPSAGAQRPPIRQLAPSSSPRETERPQVLAPRRPRVSKGGLIIGASVVLLVLILLGLFYFVPSATVTISLQAKPFSHTVQLNATLNSQTSVQNPVLAQTLTKTLSAMGEGRASGTVNVDGGKAQGSVTFINHGKTGLIIPSNTLLQTQSGIQFTTDAEFFLDSNSTYSGVPITAKDFGANSNVNANAITVIPPESLTKISQRNNLTSISAGTLTITNDQGTSGGGSVAKPAMTAQDQTTLEQKLHQQLQQVINTWLQAQTQPGDQPGKPISLGSEQLSGTPAVNQPLPDKTFSGTLTVTVRVLLVRAADLQKAAGQQLDTFARQKTPAYTLATQLPVTLTQTKSTPSSDGTSLAITATANGQIITLLDLQKISNSLTSKSISQAETDLKTGPMAQVGVEHVDISVSPSFFSILPIRASQIQIILKPIPASS